MKVRIKKTGEILNVAEYATVAMDVCDSCGNPMEYPLNEIEIVEDSSKKLYCQSEVNWRQVGIQAAVGAMQAILTSRINYDKPSEIAYQAANYANALVRELKERELKKGGNV